VAKCEACGSKLPERSGPGRPRHFCSARCRRRAFGWRRIERCARWRLEVADRGEHSGVMTADQVRMGARLHLDAIAKDRRRAREAARS
jgi:hypothetical protein